MTERCFAVHYKYLEPSPTICWNGEKEPFPGAIGAKEEGHEKFVKEVVKPGDTFYFSMGGGADKFCLALVRKGAFVFRIPTHRLKRIRQDQDLDKENLHMALHWAATNAREDFYPFTEKDISIAELQVLTRAFDTFQKGIRIPAQLRLASLSKDMSLVFPDRVILTEKDIKESPPIPDLIRTEKGIKKDIEALLKKIPVYKDVFQQIRGCGPLIAGRIIAEIGDTRKFPNELALRSYAGWGQEDGKPRKRKKGKTSNWNNTLKTAIFLFCDQVNRSPEDAPFRRVRDEYRAWDEKNNPDKSKGHYFNRARRRIAQIFISHIFHAWCRFEGLPFDPKFIVE